MTRDRKCNHTGQEAVPLTAESLDLYFETLRDAVAADDARNADIERMLARLESRPLTIEQRARVKQIRDSMPPRVRAVVECEQSKRLAKRFAVGVGSGSRINDRGESC